MAGAIAAPAYIGRAYANPYARFRGTTLVVNFPAHPHYDAVAKVLPKFTAETGIKVEVDKLQFLRMRDKQLLEMSKPGKGDYDLLAYVVFWKTEYAERKLIREIGPMFKDANLALPDYDFDDLISGYVENIGLVGRPQGLSGRTWRQALWPALRLRDLVLGYRKDIFAKHNIKVPETYAELEAAITRIPQVESGMGGLASRGQTGHHVVHAWLLHLAPLGGRIFDDKWEPIFQNEAGVKAAELLKKIIDTGPQARPASASTR